MVYEYLALKNETIENVIKDIQHITNVADVTEGIKKELVVFELYSYVHCYAHILLQNNDLFSNILETLDYQINNPMISCNLRRALHLIQLKIEDIIEMDDA